MREGTLVGLANHTLLTASDGSKRLIDDSATPIRDEAGNVAAVVLVFRDTSQRKQFEQKLQAALDYTTNIIGTLRHPFLVLDKNLCIVSANRSFFEHFHVTEEETHGQFVYDLGNGQ